MTTRERFQAVLNGKLPSDRLPVMEWASWWDLTLDRWHKEGLDSALKGDALFREMHLDLHHQYWFIPRGESCPEPAYFGAGIMQTEEQYEALLPLLYPEDRMNGQLEDIKKNESMHQAGDTVVWYTVEGAFWFPRTLFGIENHLYSFYDYPELYHRILEDHARFTLAQLERLYAVCTPEFMTFAEDMSYNGGPMISHEMFREFLEPFYKKIIPYIHAHGTRVLCDSDGDVTKLIPWLQEAGFDGILPLERQAGVDIARIRADHPDFLMLGAYNKRVMKHGEQAMREEFERVLPVMHTGGYIPSVDHQTPPDVSLGTYRIYVDLLHEYARKAVL